MAVGQAPAKIMLELYRKGLLQGRKSIVEMGSQDMNMNLSYFQDLLGSYGMKVDDLAPFDRMKSYPERPRTSSREFYKLLGLSEYSCVDLDKVHGAIPIDLNQPFSDQKWSNHFDVVTDFGTNEHIFNVGEAYRTLHRLCKQSGLMIIQQCIYLGNGFYNFDLGFFESLAAANGYEIMHSSYVVDVSATKNQYHIPVARDLIKAVDWAKTDYLGICYVFKKVSNEDFKMPYQDSYMSQVYKNQGYSVNWLPTPPRYSYVPVVDREFASTSFKTLIGIVFARIRQRLGKKLRWAFGH